MIGISGDRIAGYEGFDLDIMIIFTSNYVSMELYVHSIMLDPSRISMALYYIHGYVMHNREVQ